MRFFVFAISLTPFLSKNKSQQQKTLLALVLPHWLPNCYSGAPTDAAAFRYRRALRKIILEVVSRAAAAARRSTGVPLIFLRRSDGRASKSKGKTRRRHLTGEWAKNARHNAGACLLFTGVRFGHRLLHLLVWAFSHLSGPTPGALAKALRVDHWAHQRTDRAIGCFHAIPPALRRTHPLVSIPGVSACILATLMWGTA